MHSTLRRDVVKPRYDVLQNNTIQSIPDCIVSLTRGSECTKKRGSLMRECPIGHSEDISDTHPQDQRGAAGIHLASTALGASISAFYQKQTARLRDDLGQRCYRSETAQRTAAISL